MEETIKQMETDDLADKVELVGKASPREYAQMRGMTPQIVYYYLRNKRLEMETCICGRHVIDIKLADEFFTSRQSKVEPEVSKEEEVPRSNLDTGE